MPWPKKWVTENETLFVKSNEKINRKDSNRYEMLETRRKPIEKITGAIQKIALFTYTVAAMHTYTSISLQLVASVPLLLYIHIIQSRHREEKLLYAWPPRKR